MQKRTLFNLTAFLLGLIILSACEYASIEPSTPTPPPPPPPGDSTSYSLEVQPMFDRECVVCHSGSEPPDLRAGKSYASIFENNMVVKAKPDESILYTCLLPGGKMKSYGNTANKALLYNWILEGAKNN